MFYPVNKVQVYHGLFIISWSPLKVVEVLLIVVFSRPYPGVNSKQEHDYRSLYIEENLVKGLA